LNYLHEQADLIDYLITAPTEPVNHREAQILRKNVLDFTKRVRYESTKRCELLREIRIAQNEMNEPLEIKLLRQLAKLECENARS
jgi:hypothetical protein